MTQPPQFRMVYYWQPFGGASSRSPSLGPVGPRGEWPDGKPQTLTNSASNASDESPPSDISLGEPGELALQLVERIDSQPPPPPDVARKLLAWLLPDLADAAWSPKMTTEQRRPSLPYSPKTSGSDFSRPPRPTSQAHSDSGVWSGLSNAGSQPAILPPPPPYRMMTRGQGRIHRSLSDSKYAPPHAALQPHSARNSWASSRSPSPSMSTVSCPEYGELQDRLQRLAIARESLSLQVSVLTEQVGAQSDKIKDLESLLDERKSMPPEEDMGYRDYGSGSKLNLMTEVGALKQKFSSLERDKLDTEQRLRFATSEISQLQKVLMNRTAPAYEPPPPAPQPMDPNELNSLVHRLRHRSKDAADEIESLRMTVQQLASANSEKELHIEQLRTVLDQQARVVDRLGPTEGRLGPTEGRLPSIPRSVSAYAAAQHPPGLNDHQTAEFDINRQLQKLLAEEGMGGQSSDFPNSTSFPDSFGPAQPAYSTYLGGPTMQSSSSYTSSLSGMTGTGSSPSANWSPRHAQGFQRAPAVPEYPEGGSSSPAARQLALELDQLASSSRTSTETVRGLNGAAYYTGSLPRSFENNKKPPSGPRREASEAAGPTRSSGRAKKASRGKEGRDPGWLAKRLHRLALAKRSASAPNLDKVEQRQAPDWSMSVFVASSDSPTPPSGPSAESDDETLQSASQLNDKLRRDKKNRSLRNLFSKLKRSGSQEMDKDKGRDFGDGSGFKRGVLTRATAAPRLGSAWTAPPSQHIPLRPPLALFSQWAPAQLCDWLGELGLGQYGATAEKVLQSGRHLMTMTQAEMEKELEIRSSLHRKKLTLALRAIEDGKSRAHEKMDHHQVLRWLDDIGLPQYRDTFAEARIDGQMLEALSVEDLLALKITSALHHASISRGIAVLRLLNWNLARLHRKFAPEDAGAGPAEVQLWSHHCVAEWLRRIDLAEFTPNLMCAGIHGALLVLEPTFTPESLALVLEMADAKTLLRRHLSTHLNRLLGPDIVAAKRQALALPFHTQLSPSVKVKPLKKGFSLTRKKSKTELYVEPDELVAPPTPHPIPLRLRASSSMSVVSLPPPPSPSPMPSSRSQRDLQTVISESMLENLASSNV